MFDRRTIIILSIFSHVLIVLAKNDDLSPQELEAAKKFFKDINQKGMNGEVLNQNGKNEENDKPLKAEQAYQINREYELEYNRKDSGDGGGGNNGYNNGNNGYNNGNNGYNNDNNGDNDDNNGNSGNNGYNNKNIGNNNGNNNGNYNGNYNGNNGSAEKKSYKYKHGISGGMKFADDLFFALFPVGDKYGGMADNILYLAKYCVEFAIKGLTVIGYTTIRYPHKFLLKAMVAIGALSWITTNAAYCLSPVSIANYVAKGKIVNKNMAQLAKHTEEWKIRLANTIDKLQDGGEVQKHGCCAFFDYKKKMYDTTHDDAKEFIASYFAGFFKMHQLVFCQQYTEESQECESVQFIDEEPVRMLPRSWITLTMELFLKYI